MAKNKNQNRNRSTAADTEFATEAAQGKNNAKGTQNQNTTK
ncbi:hypothetical protein [Paenibacillus sp. KN14-4R]